MRITLFTPIILYNPFYLGDTVLLEGVATAIQTAFSNDIYIASHYPELFIEHPSIKGIGLNDNVENARKID